MGLIDSLGSALGGGTDQSSGIARSLMELLASGQGGGLGGLVESFKQNGLGKIIESWIGSGQNLPISASQIQSVLGPKVQAMAQQHGLSVDVVSQLVSEVLPKLVSHLAQGGQIPQGGALEQGLSALRSKFGI
jgi:uncharacterized protein YidB (DUF937 family)